MSKNIKVNFTKQVPKDNKVEIVKPISSSSLDTGTKKITTTSNKLVKKPAKLLSVPVQYISFNIVIVSNLGTLSLKNSTVLKYLKPANTSKEILEDKKTINFTTKFLEDESYIYNKIIDACNLDFTELVEVCHKAFNYFEDYEVSSGIKNRIDTYISTLGKHTKVWEAIFSKPDYNLCLFKKRMLPYFHLECKDWVKANLETMKQDYPTAIIGAKKSEEDDFTDELNIASKHNNFLEWSILPVEEYPNMEKLINNIIKLNEIGLERQALLIFLRLLLSPKNCHIVKEPSIWKIVKPQMQDKDVEEIVRYCCCYAMYILRQEETIMFSQVKSNYRVIFTLEQACNLPTFDKAPIDRDPYILQLTDVDRISDSVIFYLRKGRKINTPKEFQRRFNLATGGAFKNVDLKSLGASITGSILIPCVHSSPLEESFTGLDWNRDRTMETPFPWMVDTPVNQKDADFLNYLEYYYASYCSLTDEEYKIQVLKKEQTEIKIEDNNDLQYDDDNNNISTAVIINSKLQNTTVEAEPEKTKVKTNVNSTTVSKSVNSTTVSTPLKKEDTENKSKRKVEYNQLADIDVSITTKDLPTFKINALALYEKIKKNCEHRGPVYIKEVKTIASVKYKVYGPGLPRPIDIFRIPYDPIKMVKKFHVHPVKMYYDNEVFLFRSCIASLLSGVGENYKWFSCNKVPIDVLLKYAQRGLTIILNSNERKAVTNYLNIDERWGLMLKHLKIKPERIYCCVPASHSFFNPGMYNAGIRLGLRKFNKESKQVYSNSLVVPHSKSLTPYGELLIKDNNKFYPPDVNKITACFEHIDSREAEESEIED